MMRRRLPVRTLTRTRSLLLMRRRARTLRLPNHHRRAHRAGHQPSESRTLLHHSTLIRLYGLQKVSASTPLGDPNHDWYTAGFPGN